MTHVECSRTRGVARLMGVGLALALGVCLAFVACGESTEDASVSDPGGVAGGSEGHGEPIDWGADDRLRELLSPCPGLGHFDGDTSDMLPVLVSKLEKSQRDVLRNIKEELALSGEPAIVELDRLVRRVASDRHRSHTVVNALGIVELSDAGGCKVAQELLRFCLGHPQEVIRTAALRALERHATAPLYGDLLDVLTFTKGAQRALVVGALYQADRPRFEKDLAHWAEQNIYPELLAKGARLVAAGAGEETGALYEVAISQVRDGAARAFLVATRAGRDDGSARRFLDEMLADEDPRVRADALAAIDHTDEIDLVIPIATGDPVADVRLMACGLLGGRLDAPGVRQALHQAINDSADAVRGAALALLLAGGDERAADYALSLLGQAHKDIELACRALVGNWKLNPSVAPRALELLTERFEERSAEPLSKREFLVQAIAQIPGPTSTRFLLERAAECEEEIHAMRGARWLRMQTGNTGPVGRLHIQEAWRVEEDLVARMDLLWPATFGHDGDTREFLLEVLDAERSAPHERLFVAERLAAEGPASQVAPILKRANLRMVDPVFRPAMECLLWRWYGL